jgi:hypothetical protein
MSSDAPIIHGTWTTVLGPDGSPRWVEITSFLQRERHRLHFVDAMAKVWRRPFTIGQEKYLQALYRKLEGRATTNWP